MLCPSTKLFCLSGSGSRATDFIIDRQTLLNPCNMITPTIDDLQECSNNNEVKAVEAPAADGLVTYPGSNSFLPAPWLRDTVMSSGTSNYAKLIAKVNAAAFEFDAEHKEDKNYITTASVHAADFILWAWGAGNRLAAATKMTFDPNDEDLEQFRFERHQQCISQPWVATLPGATRTTSSRSQQFSCPSSCDSDSPSRCARSS